MALSIGAAILNSTTPSTLDAVYQACWQFGATTLAAIFAVYTVGTPAALLVCAAGAMMFALADSVFHLFAGWLLAGAGTGAVVGAANAAMVELDPRQDRVRAVVMALVAFTADASLGSIISAAALASRGGRACHQRRQLAGAHRRRAAEPARSACRSSPRPLAWSIGSTFMALGPTFTVRLFDLNHRAVGAFTLVHLPAA